MAGLLNWRNILHPYYMAPLFVHSSIPSFILYSVNISGRPTVEAWAQKEIRHSTCPYQTYILVWLSRDLKVIRCQVVL